MTKKDKKRPYTLSEAAMAQRRKASPAGAAAPKSGYTMSEAAVQQRHDNLPAAAAAATGPVTPEGKAASSRNAWKHGRYSAINRAQFASGATSLAKMFGKPCVTTCPFHPDNPNRTEAPCSLVLDGLTRAGGSCLDKTVYVHALDSLMAAFTEGDMDGMHGLLATEMAGNLQLLRQIREEIAERGLLIEIPAVTKDGVLVLDAEGNRVVGDLKPNPILAHMIKLNESLGINLAELMATPRAREKLRDDDEAAGGLQSLLGAIFNRAQRKLPPLDDGA